MILITIFARKNCKLQNILFFSIVPEDMQTQRFESERMRKTKYRLVKALSEDGHSNIANTTL